MYTLQRFIIMTLEPAHIGTGGYRLGRVDNSIAREPGTNLPKIPGTSLSLGPPVLCCHALRKTRLRRTGRSLRR